MQHLCDFLSHVFPTSPSPPQVFPLFHALGANGLLIEYEDMFPYEGHLRLLRAQHAYRWVRRAVAAWLCGQARQELNEGGTLVFWLVKCVSLIIKIRRSLRSLETFNGDSKRGLWAPPGGAAWVGAEHAGSPVRGGCPTGPGGGGRWLRSEDEREAQHR